MSLQIAEPSTKAVAQIYKKGGVKPLASIVYTEKYSGNPCTKIALLNGKGVHFEDDEDEDDEIFNEREHEIVPNTFVPSEAHLQYIIAGPTGCGKSTFCADFAKRYLHSNTNSRVIIVKPLPDKAFADLPEKRTRHFTPKELYELKQESLTKSGTEDDFFKMFKPEGNGRVLFIFDDIEAQIIKAVGTFLMDFIHKVALEGRKFGFDCLIILHQASNGKKTSLLQSESTHVWCNPRYLGGSKGNLIYTLKDKFNMPAKVLSDIKKQTNPNEKLGHHFVYSSQAPNILIAPKMCMLTQGF